jgi:hypothetical protein
MRVRKCVAALAGALWMGTAGAAGSDDLNTLFSHLAARQHGHVEFIEQHFIAMLDRPTESAGELRYDAPDHLEKHTLTPRAESMVLQGDKLTIDRGKTHRTVDMRSYPQVLPFIESIRATLAGDRAALEKLFTVEFAGNLARWTLTLLPRDAHVKRTVSQVRIDGAQDQLLKVEIKQTDGDRSVMTLRPAPTP